MALNRYVLLVTSLGIAISILAQLVLIVPYNKYVDMDIGPLILPSPPRLVGPFAPNSLLRHHVRRIGDGLIPMPEDVAAIADASGSLYLYAACQDGWIKRVNPSSGEVEDWVHIGAGARPLGLAAGLHGELIVCNPDMGLLNVTKGKVELLVDQAEGVRFKFTNAAVVSQDGSIFFTDASYKYPLRLAFHGVFESRPHGRFLKYDPTTKSTVILLDNLYTPNGVALSTNEEFVVVCESIMARCQRYWLKGDKVGTAEIFIDNLPGLPDNIKNDGNGHFWICLVMNRPYLYNELNKYPFVKRLLLIFGPPEKWIPSVHQALVLSTNEEGIPLLTLGDPTGASIHFVTTALVIGENMYLGSLGVSFIGHVNLTNIPNLITH